MWILPMRRSARMVWKLLKKIARRCDRLIGISLVRSYLYRLEKPPEMAAVMPIPNAQWDLLAPGQAGRLAEIGPFDSRDCAPRFERGDVCYLASLGGRPAHYSWVQRSGVHPFTEAGCSLPVAAGEFWIYHCRTAEWARGKGIYPATLQRIVQEHFESGYRTAWIYTTRENVASQKGILRAGFAPVATFTALRVGGRYYCLERAAKLPGTSNQWPSRPPAHS